VNIGNLQAPVSLADTGLTGTDSLTVLGTPGTDTFVQTTTQIIANGQAITLGTGLEAITVDGGGGVGDTFNVQGTPSIVATVVGVNDTILTGTPDGDTIVLNRGSNVGEIVAKLNGKVVGTYRPTGRMIVYGLGGDDDVQVAGSITVPLWLFGGDGDDRLKGGDGANVLVGGDGDDLVVGGKGRNLLIGGKGKDRIVGGSGDDILIAGWTAYDASPTALDAVLHEWTRTDRTYAQRVDALKAGVGDGGAVKLTAATVFSDADEDKLTGSAGNDWFFYDSTRDKVTDLSDPAFANDLPFIGP
jgi:Ca2+-binding RTX toxin-like protein